VMFAFFLKERSIRVEPLVFSTFEVLVLLWWVETLCLVVEHFNFQIITYVHDLGGKWHCVL